MPHFRKAVVIGLDGLEPSIVEPMLECGELPALARLRNQGGYARVATTCPAQTPVAWSSFATGVNPGGHGIFDFVHRDPKTYSPVFSLNRYEQKNIFSPPKAVNLRRGTPVWQLLGDAGIPSVVLRCPCTYPPDEFRGRMLAGMGVPDIRGSQGTAVIYSTDPNEKAHENENVVRIDVSAQVAKLRILGPRNPKSRDHYAVDVAIKLAADGSHATLSGGESPASLKLVPGQWSDWLKVKFKVGAFQSMRGMVRLYPMSLAPTMRIYCSPVNFDPKTPPFPISSPPDYAGQIESEIGAFYTTGMVEDHGGLNNERFDEASYLDHCDEVLGEREKMLQLELGRLQEGLLYCLFDTPDRIQHMFWRFRDREHPSNRRYGTDGFQDAIAENYRKCDRIVERAMKCVDDRTLLIVLSDHGFNGFRRGVHVNSWLHAQGLLKFKGSIQPGDEAGDFFRDVDWSQTKAYAVGLASIYLNVKGREGQGIVEPDEAPALRAAIADKLSGLVDPETGQVAVRGASTRDQAYRGAYLAEAPDLVVHCAAGYRYSWGTALGGAPHGLFEDNVKKWSGDHIIDPALVPGVLLMNRPFHGPGARLIDLAPTLLAALGAPPSAIMEGASLLP